MNDEQMHSLKQFILTTVRQAVVEEVDTAVNRAVGPAVDKAVNEAVGPAVDKAVNQAVGPALDKAVNEAVGPAVDKAVGPAVDTAVTRATAHLASKDDLQTTERRLHDKLSRRMDTMQAAIVETITIVNDAHDVHFNEHERRLIALERFDS